jgi:hypothetical protein
MLKLIGEGALAFIAVYSVRKPISTLAQNKPSSYLDAWNQGAAIGALGLGAALASPVTAPVGAFMLVRDGWKSRSEIMENLRAAKNFTADKLGLARDEVSTWFTRDHEEKVAVLEISEG